MHTRTNLALFACLLSLVGLACSSSPEAESSTSLQGDWLPCDNADCSQVSDDGYRFLADGTALHINAEEFLVSAAPLCIELERSAGAYQFDGTTITLEGLSLKAELAGDFLTVHDVPWGGSDGLSGVVTARMRRVSTYEGAPCPSR